jgi:hypothetical protein
VADPDRPPITPTLGAAHAERISKQLEINIRISILGFSLVAEQGYCARD